MSTFKVEVKKLSKVFTHPNADKLELAQVEGMLFQFAVLKGAYKQGDEIVYFPVDSMLPQAFIQQQGIGNFLAGREKNRVKTITFRGEISQGYVASVESVQRFLQVDVLPENVTDAMGVLKYEPPEIKISDGNLVPMPEFVGMYDIEGCDRFPHIIEMLMDIPCMISEKMEGTNYWCSINKEKNISVGQRQHAIENIPGRPEHSFWVVSRREGLLDALEKLSEVYINSTITIRGEMIGPQIQGNYYRLKNLTIFIYDIEVNGRAISFLELAPLLEKCNLKRLFVPVLAAATSLREFLNGKTIQQAAHGISVLNPTNPTCDINIFSIKEKDRKVEKIREGIVIKPMVEQQITGFGRLFLKQRDPVYLDVTGN